MLVSGHHNPVATRDISVCSGCLHVMCCFVLILVKQVKGQVEGFEGNNLFLGMLGESRSHT